MKQKTNSKQLQQQQDPLPKSLLLEEKPAEDMFCMQCSNAKQSQQKGEKKKPILIIADKNELLINMLNDEEDANEIIGKSFMDEGMHWNNWSHTMHIVRKKIVTNLIGCW